MYGILIFCYSTRPGLLLIVGLGHRSRDSSHLYQRREAAAPPNSESLIKQICQNTKDLPCFFLTLSLEGKYKHQPTVQPDCFETRQPGIVVFKLLQLLLTY
jgi:hypothetical protein